MSNKIWVKVPLKNIISVTRVVTLLCYDLSPKFYTSGESHDFWELVYVDRGELEIRAGDDLRHLKQGEIAFHQPNEFHSVRFHPHLRLPFLRYAVFPRADQYGTVRAHVADEAAD